MTLARSSREGNRLSAYALFAALLASAGLPIYIHAPKVYVDTYGVSLAALGTALFGLRLLDVVQDPLLGRLAGRLQHRRGLSVTCGLVAISVGMVGLYAVSPPVAPIVWFALTLTLVFSGFSFLTICFYAQGVQKAGDLNAGGHLRVARWRETGALTGVCLAAIAPVALAGASDTPFVVFAWGFVALAVLAGAAMANEWRAAHVGGASNLGTVLGDALARRLLLIALVNAAPVAVSSTLFLFFVETRLGAPGMEGALLVAFFFSAACAAPVWSWFAERFGARKVLGIAMALSIAAFANAFFLQAGDWIAFAVICVASGAALGADMTLLPAMFSERLSQISPGASEAFGLWNFVSKFTLAFAAVALLPALEMSGFAGGAPDANPDRALFVLSALYAGVPCVLKLCAIWLLVTTRFEEDQ
jgi:GPH family glycoside/pentoside/hexuronide:cation symporter